MFGLQVVKDRQLLGMVAVLLAIDLIVLIIWEIADSQHVKEVTLEEKVRE